MQEYQVLREILSETLEENTGTRLLKRLVLAAGNGNLEAVHNVLAEWWAMPEPIPERGDDAYPMFHLHPALEAAIMGNHTAVVSYLLDNKFRCRDPAVSAAIRSSSIGSLELLLRHGWNINKRRRTSEPPPLSEAVETDDEEVIRWFLVHGADTNAYGRDHARTPLTYAAQRASLNTVMILFEYGGDARIGSPLHSVIRGTKPGRLAIFEYLLEKGAPIDGLEYEEHHRLFQVWRCRGLGTPLHAAVKVESEIMIAALLGKGADRTIKDTLGRTPFDLAEEWGLARIAEFLRDNW
ncbi:hypothetical protein MMC18_006628 [Xylographa bjoerkii]|nr:hypothetical protein [Xylographa bjoerkii]